MRRNARFHRTR